MLIGVSIIIVCGMWLIIYDNTYPEPDAVAINDAVITALQSDDPTETREIITGIMRREYERMETVRRNRDVRLFILLCILLISATAVTLAGFVYINRTILIPFKRMQNFAKDIAAGNLDIPLEMDKGGIFGNFTESFDLMREELKRAKENARAADRSKKELVASLSHDIKTPVASIKATVELMQISSRSEKEQKQLNQINTKAEQINTLVTDMFHATLQELEELSVITGDIQSTLLPEMIRSADYKNRVGDFNFPGCIVVADTVRLQQTFDNIIGNSYKYADTDISINTGIDGDYLIIEISDFGSGVPEDELPLLTNKYYRGKNAADKSGYGLGLYISSYLISKMSGEMDCETGDNGGFTVIIRLKLA